MMPTRHAVIERLRAAGCVFAEQEADILFAATRDPAHVEALVAERVLGRPLEQVVGWAEFAGMRIIVEPGVFVPRRRTELLVAQVLELAGASAIVVDLCCGSGAIAAVVAAHRPGADVYAVDIDPDAVRCARRNLGDAGQVLLGDLDTPLPASLRGRVDVIVANAPYVPTSEIRWLPPEARVHERAVTLDGGSDGLDVQRRVAAAAPGWLTSGGHLLIETSAHQCESTVAACTANGFTTQVVTSDDLGAIVVIGTLSVRAGAVGPGRV